MNTYSQHGILLLLSFLLLLSCSSDSSVVIPEEDSQSIDCSEVTSLFTINLDPTTCAVDIENILGVNSQYTESINGTTRTVHINGVANHNVGVFPNPGNPNTITVASETFEMVTDPSLVNAVTSGQGFSFGVLFSGIAMDPYTGEFFQGSGGTTNMAWNITTLQSEVNLGLDCNNAHVQPTGRYHYHGTPARYLDDLGTADGSQMLKVGYAADGFPIYYKFGYADDNTTIITFQSGYALKMEARGGDGLTAPDGCPDGLYFQDYEYVDGLSYLDQCNGRMGKTLESDNEYYYVITDNFPSSPLCFSGTPDDSFRAF